MNYPFKSDVGSRFLVIELEVDTREEEGWQEKVVYSAWDNIAYRSEDIVEYELCNELKSWSDAEAHCQRYGGHLASVLTQEEQEVTGAAASGQTVWIGGSDQEKEGIRSWPDGSKWNYTRWYEGYGNKGNSRNCVLMMDGNDWIDFNCAETFAFLCQFPAHQLTGKKNITLTFTQEQLTFSSFTVLYSYYYNQELVDSWQDKRMTGFRLKWRLDPPPLEMTVQELGRSVQTPGLGRDTFDREDYIADREYKTTLLLPHNIQEMVGKGALVVQLEVDTREEEGWKEVVKTSQGGQKIYKLYEEEKTWSDAEEHCQGERGHLASVLTQEEQEEVKVAAGGNDIWIGGSDQHQEGSWRWTDGSQWNFTNWGDGAGNVGNSWNCVQLFTDASSWFEYNCEHTIPFLCQSSSLTMINKSSISFSFTADDISFSEFSVWYSYSFSSQDLVDSWQDKRMTGFRLSWFLQDSSGNRLTEEKTDMEEAWKLADADVPRYRNWYLAKMVELASVARMKNMTREDILKETIKEKDKLIRSGSIEYTTMCSHGQVESEHYSTIFNLINVSVISDSAKTPITDEDVNTGFMMFTAIVYCSEPVALSQFLHSLLSTQSPRTILQATVNTIQSDKVKEKTRQLLNEFYQNIQNTFNLQHGKILLALSSASELESMIAKNRPYFTPYSQEIEQCLTGTNCQGVRDLIHSIGNGETDYPIKLS